jgi:hypothetical protein
MKPTTRLETVEVTADGEGLVSHAGIALLAEVADRTGLTKALSSALASTRERHSQHDPGRVVRDLALMLCDGDDCVTDLEALRGQGALFGPVASETTAHRVVKSIDLGPRGPTQQLLHWAPAAGTHQCPLKPTDQEPLRLAI